MWATIAFSIYVTIYIAVILVQINAEKHYSYNSAIEETIKGTETSSSPILTLSKTYNYNDVAQWLTEALPKIGRNITQEVSNYTGYYILDVNYMLDNSIKMCFTLSAIQDPAYDEETGYTAWYYKDGDSSHEFTEKFNGDVSGKSYTYTDDGYQGNGGYCQVLKIYPQESFNRTMTQFLADMIISDKLLTLTLEFVTFEAS